MIDDPAGWVGATAAVAAAALVAWQSWETRRAADASADALKTANAALAVSREQVAEAVRTRIDNATPVISVYQDSDTWPPLEPSGDFGGRPNPLLPGLHPEPMLLPRDQSRQITVRASVRVVNESARHVRLNVRGLIQKEDETTPVPSSVLLAPGAGLDAWCASTHSLRDWIELHAARSQGETGREPAASIRYDDPADTGAVDRWDLTITGVPIAPRTDINDAWQIIPNPHGSFAPIVLPAPVVLRHRRYYLSKSRGEEITS